MNRPKLHLELLSGPLDGFSIVLETEALWTSKGDGDLAFPWDEELGDPQGRFYVEQEQWYLEAFPADHGTYRMSREGRVVAPIQLEVGDVLRASKSWLIVRRIE